MPGCRNHGSRRSIQTTSCRPCKKASELALNQRLRNGKRYITAGNSDLNDICLVQLRSANAPIALGRSGPRIERGMKTSGLLGERFNDSAELSRNNFVQRAWLYTPDPALEYKKNGLPPAAPEINDRSLHLGPERTYDPEAFHGRTGEITGNYQLVKRGPSVYMDEQFFRIRKYPPPYPDTMKGYDALKFPFYRAKQFRESFGATKVHPT
jgi:hypothetical protein